jgi:hypothetical protein
MIVELEDAVELSESDRAIGVLLESRDPRPTPEVKAAWSKEIERRVREIDGGAVELLTGKKFAQSCLPMNEGEASPEAQSRSVLQYPGRLRS